MFLPPFAFCSPGIQLSTFVFALPTPSLWQWNGLGHSGSLGPVFPDAAPPLHAVQTEQALEARRQSDLAAVL